MWLVCGWFGWFVDGLAVLWVVSSFTANVEEDKNESLIFASKRDIKSARKLNVKYKNIKIKQHKVTGYRLRILVVFWMKPCLGNL